MVKPDLKIGVVGEQRFVVSEKHSIDFAGDGMPPVLATPWLIWYLEHSGRDAVKDYFEDGESLVGVHIDVEHLAPTPLGQEVICRSKLVQRQGRRVWLRVEAFDEEECIGKGTIQMYIIKKEQFAARVQEKS